MITPEEFTELGNRHRERLQKLNSKESFVDTLGRLHLLSRSAYRNSINEIESEYDSVCHFWVQLKSEYFGTRR